MTRPLILTLFILLIASVFFAETLLQRHDTSLEAGTRFVRQAGDLEENSTDTEAPLLLNPNSMIQARKGGTRPDHKHKKVRISSITRSETRMHETGYLFSEMDVAALQNLATNDENPQVRADALNHLGPESCDIFITALEDPSPKVKQAAISRMIQLIDKLNDDEKETIENEIENIVTEEKDDTLVEAGIEFFDLSDSEWTSDVIASALEKDNLSFNTLSYIVEILLDEFEMNKVDIIDLINDSPSFQLMSQYDRNDLIDDLKKL